VTYPLDDFAGTEPDEGPRRVRAALILATAAVAAVVVGLVAVWVLHDRPDRAASAGPTGLPVISDSPDPGVSIDESPEPTASPATVPPKSTGPTARPSGRPSPTAAPPPPQTQAPKPPPPPVPTPPTPPGGCTTGCVLAGDGTTRIGGVVPGAAKAGTYHSNGPARGGSCTWSLSRDEAGNDQIAGKTVNRPTDVNVRDRTFFHSDNCAVWTLAG
jgi:hypothetical protein